MFTKQQLNRFYQYAYSLTSNEDEAYDLLQNSLEKYLKNQHVINSPRAWMMKVIRNQFYDQLRRKQPQLVELDESRVASIADEFESLEKMLIDKEQISQLWAMLGSAEREILYFWAVMGCTSSEIARTLDMPRGTVVSKIHRIKNKLRRNSTAELKRAV